MEASFIHIFDNLEVKLANQLNKKKEKPKATDKRVGPLIKPRLVDLSTLVED